MKSIKDFIYQEFFFKQVLWLLLSLTIFFVILNALQLRSGIRSTRDKIDTIIELNQSEIFSSIVLKDFEALRDHLDLIKKQDHFDYVALKIKDVIIETDENEVPFYYRWIKLFNPTYSKLVHNEFETVSFRVEARFGSSIIVDHFIPYLRMSFLMFFLLVGVLYVFFSRQIKRVQGDIIRPLTELVGKLEKDELDNEERSFHLKELHILYEVMKSYPKLKKDSTIAEISSQVAHDIRSPLEALKSAKDEIAKLPELERNSINLAIGRIEEIAYNLLVMRKRVKRLVATHTHVKSTLNQIIQEKRMQYRGHPELVINLSSGDQAFSVFTSMEPETFKRVISNLLANASEAIGFNGSVEIDLQVIGRQFIVRVMDVGPKLTPHQFCRIFEKGFTSKSGGNGLGLYNAKKEIEAAGGNIDFTQEEQTNVTVTLPLSETPGYFATVLDISKVKKVIILDDDESIHQVWKKRFKNTGIELEHFYKAFNLLDVFKEISEDTIFLSDFELLGEELNGVDCINKLHAVQRSILVTARADEPQIIRLCEQYGIKLLPKSMANEVKIMNHFSDPKTVVLIDDDNLTHLSWKLASKNTEVNLKTYYSVKEFLENSYSLERRTPIYIDLELGPDLRGDVLSEDIFKQGFTELYITTGYDPDDIGKPQWIKDILVKKPPFQKEVS
jgi:signal transduction histidine kinase/FixJ family two-component response regulator